jgi:hypothetical protein
MLARALNCLRICPYGKASKNIATAALDQPGDEMGLMAEEGPVCNVRVYRRFMETAVDSTLLGWRVFFTRTGLHPRVKPEGMLRLKTL